jgi:hypothetical protein
MKLYLHHEHNGYEKFSQDRIACIGDHGRNGLPDYYSLMVPEIMQIPPG